MADDDDDENEDINVFDQTNALLNVPTLITWLSRNIDRESTISQGFNRILTHLDTGEGCEVMVQNDVRGLVIRAQARHVDKEQIQILCLLIFRRLLDCNSTRIFLIMDTDILKITFSIGYSYVNNSAVVDTAMRCLAQCSKSEICRREIISKCLVGYCTTLFGKKYINSVSTVRSLIQLYNYLTTSAQRMEEVCRSGAVAMTIRCMKKHRLRSEVLSPGMFFLTRAANQYTPAAEYIIQKKAISVVLHALKACSYDDVLTLEGLKLVKQLSLYEDGWKQIDETEGGWSIIASGTVTGDAIMHESEGPLHNPGWCIGDTNFMTVNEANRREVEAMEAPKILRTQKSKWTNHAFRAFMEIPIRAKSLQANNDYHDIFFEIIGTLDLFPYQDETKENWFKRIYEYEEESHIKIEDMAKTVVAIRDKELEEKKAAARLLAQGSKYREEYAKPVFAMGHDIRFDSLVEGDMTLEEKFSQLGLSLSHGPRAGETGTVEGEDYSMYNDS